MSAPALPESFGNYALGAFHEAVAPGAISWVPQTPGWYVVAATVGLWLARRAWLRLRRWYRNRYRREALAQLRQLEQHPDRLNSASLNRLLKLTVLAAWPRREVASLSGRDWVDFLNRQCESGPFRGALAQQLALGPYGAAAQPAEPAALAAACRHWIAGHRSPLDA